MDVQHTHEKIFWTFQIRSSKNLGPTKYPREKRYPRRSFLKSSKYVRQKMIGLKSITKRLKI